MAKRRVANDCLQESSRLQRMAEDHASKLEDSSEAARLPALFAAGHIHGTHQEQLHSLQARNTSRLIINACTWCSACDLTGFDSLHN